MRAAGAVLAVVLALVLQTKVAAYSSGGVSAFDFVLVVVVYVALTAGPVPGLFVGSLAGLVQDALSSGIIGVGGLAKSLVGFLAGVLGRQFIVSAALPRFVMFLTATLVHAVIFMGLYVLLELRSFPSPFAGVLRQAAGNAVVGVVAFVIVEALPGAVERRRVSRRARR